MISFFFSCIIYYVFHFVQTFYHTLMMDLFPAKFSRLELSFLLLFCLTLCSHPGTHSHHTSEYSELFPGTLLFFGLFLLFAGIYPKGISSESTMVAKLSEVAECLRIFLFFCPHSGWVVLLCTDFQVENHFPSEFWKHSSTVFYHLELLLMKMIVCILLLFKEFVFISILENLKMFSLFIV